MFRDMKIVVAFDKNTDLLPVCGVSPPFILEPVVPQSFAL